MSFSSTLNLASATGTLNLSKLQVGTYTEFSPADPATTTSLTNVMAGLGSTVTFTPTKSGKLLIFAYCDLRNSTVNDGSSINLAYGTGAAPANGAAPVGTLIGGEARVDSAIANGQTMVSLVTFLDRSASLNTAIWIDFQWKALVGGTSSILFIASRPGFLIIEASP